MQTLTFVLLSKFRINLKISCFKFLHYAYSTVIKTKMKTKTLLFIIGSIIFPSLLFSQNDILNCGSIGAVKDIAISPKNEYISVTGQNYTHLFDSKKLNQIAILKDAIKPHTCLFYSDDVLIILGSKKTYKYNIQSADFKTLTEKVYQCGYVDPLNNKVYLIDNNALDIYKDFKIEKSFEVKEACKSIISTEKNLILGYQNGDINIHKKPNFSLIKTLQGHKTAVNTLSINDSDSVLVSGAARDYRKGIFGEAIVWNIETGNVLFRTNSNHKDVQSVHVNNDKVYISSLHNIKIYNLNGNWIKSIDSHSYSNPIFAIAKDKMIMGIADIGHTSNDLYEITLNSLLTERIFSHDSRQVWDLTFYKDHLIVTKDNEVSSLTSEGKIFTYPIFSHSKDIIYKSPAQIIGINLVNSKLSNDLLFLDLNKPTPFYIPISPSIKSKRFSSDFITYNGKTYALSNDNLQNISDNEILIDFNIPPANDSSLFEKINHNDFYNVRSPLRKFIFGTTELMFYEFDRSNFVLNIRNVINGQYLKQIPNVKRIFSQQGNTLNFLTNSDGLVNSLNLTSLDVTSSPIIANSSNIYLAEYNSTRRLIAVKYGQYGKNISIINMETNQNIPIRPKSKHVDCIEFSPNNKYLLTGNRYGEIEIWDIEDGKFIGLIFTGSLKNEYVVVSGQNYDGTINGKNNFLNGEISNSYKQKSGLLKSLLFDK